MLPQRLMDKYDDAEYLVECELEMSEVDEIECIDDLRAYLRVYVAKFGCIAEELENKYCTKFGMWGRMMEQRKEATYWKDKYINLTKKSNKLRDLEARYRAARKNVEALQELNRLQNEQNQKDI